MTGEETAPGSVEPEVEVEATFTILDWREEPYDEPTEGPKLTRVTITKSYRGEIEGEAVAHVLTAQGPDGAGYVASERITGRLRDREGSFVIQHGGLAAGDLASGSAEQSTWGSIVPGSGTGELAGLRGRATETRHEVLSLWLTFAD